MTKTQTTTRGCPPKRRKEYAARIRKTKIWQRATGPRSIEGKQTSNQNARKHGAYSTPWKELRAALRAYRNFLQQIRTTLIGGKIEKRPLTAIMPPAACESRQNFPAPRAAPVPPNSAHP